MSTPWEDADDLIEALLRELGGVYVDALVEQAEGRDGQEQWEKFRRGLTRALILADLMGRASAVDMMRARGAEIEFEPDSPDAFGDDLQQYQSGDVFNELLTAPFTSALETFLSRVPHLSWVAKAMAQEKKLRAFWVTSVEISESLNGIKGRVGDTLRAHGGMRGFLEAMVEEPAVQHLTMTRLETIYRTNVMTALNQGAKAQMDEPVVASQIALYQLNEIQDRRTRGNPSGPYADAGPHYQMDGFVAPPSDPVWAKIWPPNGYNCRATVSPLTWREAMRKGFASAKGVLDQAAIDRHNGSRGEFIRRGEYPDAGFS